jgi:hypothetical protein
MIYIGMDDTDNLESRGTGTLSRTIATELSKKYPVSAVTRHQLLKHTDIPFTTHNSCSVLHVDLGPEHVEELYESVKKEMMDDFIEGSDPGIFAAHHTQLTPALVAFGQDAKAIILTQGRARALARNHNLPLEGLGGTEDGVIGAVAGVGLAGAGDDGRFLRLGAKDLRGTYSVEELLNHGVDAIYTVEGIPITEGTIYNKEDKLVRLCPLNGHVVLFVEERDGKFWNVSRG